MRKSSLGIKPEELDFNLAAKINNQQEAKAESKPSSFFELEDMQAAWHTFTVSHPNLRPSVFSALSMAKLFKTPQGDLLVRIESHTAEHSLEEVRQELLPYLKNKLHLSELRMHTEVLPETDKELKPYTPGEILEQMRKLNPDLDLVLSKYPLKLK